MEVSTKMTGSLTKGTYDVLRAAYEARQRKRLEDFLECIDLRHEVMSVEDQQELNKKINSKEGQELLAEYADTITKTSSQRAAMAIALLYCQDSDFPFEESEQVTFVSAMSGLSDDFIDFFIKATELPLQEGDTPYPRAGIHNQNLADFSKGRWDEEAVFVYVNALTRVRLLLPDPKTYGAVAGSDKGWAVWFGVTNRSKKYAALLRKAEYLLQET